MSSKGNRDISIKLTAFYMKNVGLWLADNSIEERYRILAMIYTVCVLAFSIVMESRDLYYTWGDFRDCVYVSCNVATIAIALLKMFISFMHREDLLNLVAYAKKNFWHANYDPHEQVIFNTCKHTCSFLICMFNAFAQTTAASYLIKPLITNIGKNESDRVLPFDMWVSLPLSMTPYFEITFIIQAFVTYHVSVCYLCFDNFLCLLNLHTATQFRILQYRLRSLYSFNDCDINSDMKKELNCDTNKCYKEFKNTVQQHQALLEYCKQLEKVFTLIVLGQVILFSLMICLDGYLILMEDAPLEQRLTFVFHISGCMSQLLMFTYSCDTLIHGSSNVAGAVYSSWWTLLPMDKAGRMVRGDLMLVMMRSQSPCYLTAGGFFPVSLETYTTVLSTAVSYFTLLTQY